MSNADPHGLVTVRLFGEHSYAVKRSGRHAPRYGARLFISTILANACTRPLP